MDLGQGLGLRHWGLGIGFCVLGLGFRDHRVWGLYGLGIKAKAKGSRRPGLGVWGI